MTKFAALFDLHWGWELRAGRRVPIHDLKAIHAVGAFLNDFKPDVLIMGGDALDCGAVSRHHEGKPGESEGLRLVEDMRGLKEEFLDHLSSPDKRYIIGNHEDWIDQLIDKIPGLRGLIGIEQWLGDEWTVIPRGEATKIGKLVFVHGDQLKGGANPAKYAVEAYEKSIRFGHFHRAILWTKVSALDQEAKTGMSVPGLCKRGPSYGRGAPNQWTQGFLWGFVEGSGNFNDYLTIITNGGFVANGKKYKS